MVDPSIWRQLAPAMALVSTMTGFILASALLGTWLDHQLGTDSIFTGGLTLFGLIAGAVYLAKGVRRTEPHDPSPPPAP